MKTLRTHQETFRSEINTLLDTVDKGKVIAPTGAGKTVMQAVALSDYMNKVNRPGVYVILAPRIELVAQLLKEYREISRALGLNETWRSLLLNSGDPVDGGAHFTLDATDPQNQILNQVTTTFPALIEEQWNSDNRSLVIFGCYDSWERLNDANLPTIELTIADECQYVVSNAFTGVASELDSTKKLFFTATQKYTKAINGLGMQNVKLFGNVLFEVEFAEMVAKGYILPPRLHVMKANTTGDEDFDTISTVIEIVNFQKRHTSIDTAVLFACEGTSDVELIAQSDRVKVAFPDFKIFSITSGDHGARINNEKISRGDFKAEMKTPGNKIILHYDILSEGIDVPGITGVGLLRNMNQIKRQQTIGRAVRVSDGKEYAWVSVPLIDATDNDNVSDLTDLIWEMKQAGFNSIMENAVIHDPKGTPEDEPMLTVNEINEKGANLNAFLDLQDVVHQVELMEKNHTDNQEAMRVKDLNTNQLVSEIDIF